MLHAQKLHASSAPLQLSRQPVFDANFEVMGYALLMRGGDGQAKEQVEAILGSYASRYADRVVGNQLAFVRVGESHIRMGLASVLPRGRTILEIVNSGEVNEDLSAEAKRLVCNGYLVALGDFVLTAASYALLPHAHYVKLDIPRFSQEQIVMQVKVLKRYDLKIVASNIHTHEQFELCKELGFDFFQGTFLCRPRDIKSESVKVQRHSVLELLTKVNDPEVGVDELVDTIRRDGGLVVGLLRIVNSAFYGMNRRVHTAKQAISLLGLQRIRSWVALLGVAHMDDKPDELIASAMLRARMAELLACEVQAENPERYFIAGILSMLDAMMDRPMSEVVEELPLSKDMQRALLHRRGRLGRALYCVEAHERAVWNQVQFEGLTPTQIQDCWIEAVEWTRQMRPMVAK